METKRNRINYLIERFGISKNQFAKEIGTSSAMISKITTKDINFGVDVLEKIISRYPEVNFIWLLTGQGQPFNNGTTEPSNLMSNFGPETTNKEPNLPKPLTASKPEKDHAERIQRFSRRVYRELEKEQPELIKGDLNAMAFREIGILLEKLNEQYFDEAYTFLIPENDVVSYSDYKQKVIDKLEKMKGFNGLLEKYLPILTEFILEFKKLDSEKIIFQWSSDPKFFED